MTEFATILPTETTADVREAAYRIAVLPVGSFEQHGPHLPLTTDTLVAAAVARAIAEEYGLFRLPPITISCSHEHARFPGTVSISASTLAAVVEDVWDSLQQSGVAALVVVNGHGGNYVLGNVVQQANVVQPSLSLFPTQEDWQDARRHAGLESDHHTDMHAGELETSILMSAYPASPIVVEPTADHVRADRRLLGLRGIDTLTQSGVVGLPSLANATKGGLLLSRLCQAFRYHLMALGQ